jgi:small subunit ribosomal protein S6
MKHYELLYIIPGHYTEEEGESVAKKINDLVKKYEGEITLTDNLGGAKFAYPIHGVGGGNYIVVEFNAEPEKIKELDGVLKLTPEVLRFQITKKRVKTQDEIEREKVRQARLAEGTGAERVVSAQPAQKVSLEELDKKLGEILEGKII